MGDFHCPIVVNLQNFISATMWLNLTVPKILDKLYKVSPVICGLMVSG